MWKNDIDVPNYEGNRRWLLIFCDAQIASSHGEYNKEIALSSLSLFFSETSIFYLQWAPPSPLYSCAQYLIRRGKFSPFSCLVCGVHLHERHESGDWLSMARQSAGFWPPSTVPGTGKCLKSVPGLRWASWRDEHYAAPQVRDWLKHIQISI